MKKEVKEIVDYIKDSNKAKVSIGMFTSHLEKYDLIDILEAKKELDKENRNDTQR